MNCSKCGKEMENGTMQMALAYGVGGGVRWFKTGDKRHLLGTGGEILPFVPYGLDQANGFLCRDCRLVTLELPEDYARASYKVLTST